MSDNIMLIMSGVLATALVVFIMPFLIPYLQKLKFGQSIRQEGPSSHLKKAGTPTMGGLVFLPAILSVLFIAKIDTNILLVMLLFVGHAIIGFIDDYIKIVLKRNLGLKAKEKLICQIAIATIFALIYDNHSVWIPLANTYIDLGMLYYPFAILVIVGTTNAVNLTDGLDGLLSGVSVFAALAYVLICLYLGQNSLAMVAAALMGACLGFLKFNYNPARIFMGDTGSLAIGGIIAGLALVTNTSILLVILGGVYVIEAVSVIMQVTSFKLTGQRIFKMSPIHHHFELSGWNEKTVVNRFSLASFSCAALALIIFYYSF